VTDPYCQRVNAATTYDDASDLSPEEQEIIKKNNDIVCARCSYHTNNAVKEK